MIPLSQSTTYTLRQLTDLLEQMHESQYFQQVAVLDNNTVGKHVRHIIECYQSLLAGFDTDVVDYENRARDLSLETNVVLAIIELKNINLAIIAHEDDKNLFIQANQSHENEGNLLVKTSLAREIVYCLEHAIHHMAIIAIAVKTAFPEISIHPHFGFAYSTIKHLEKTVCVQ